jgi:hypothetical protein
MTFLSRPAAETCPTPGTANRGHRCWLTGGRHPVAEVEADRLQDREGRGGREHVHGSSTPVYLSASLTGETLLMFPRELAPGYYDRVVAACEQHGFQPEIRAFSDPPPQAMVARMRTTREVGIPPASFAYHTAAADPDLVARKIVEPEIMVEWSILWPGARPIGGDGSFPGERAPLCRERGWLDASADES